MSKELMLCSQNYTIDEQVGKLIPIGIKVVSYSENTRSNGTKPYGFTVSALKNILEIFLPSRRIGPIVHTILLEANVSLTKPQLLGFASTVGSQIATSLGFIEPVMREYKYCFELVLLYKHRNSPIIEETTMHKLHTDSKIIAELTMQKCRSVDTISINVVRQLSTS